MTTQDLIKNRKRIIRNIGGADKKIVMNQMVVWVNNAPCYMSVKPLMKNIDKLTSDAVNNYWKYDYKPTQESIDETIAEGLRQQKAAM